MNKVFYVILAFLIIGCNESDSEQENNYTGYEVWDTLNIYDVTLNNMDIVTTIDSLNKYFGEPDTLWERGGTLGKAEDGKTYKSFFYDGLKFAVWEDQVRLNGIDFQNSDYELKTPYGTFSNWTTKNDIKRIFKNSFSWKNKGISRYQSGFMGVMPNEIDWDNTDWLYVDNGINGSSGLIEIVLIDKKLAYILIDNIE